MQYKRLKDTIIIRIDIDEDIGEEIKNVAIKENIKLASISGLGAVGKLTVGVYKPKKKKYYSNSFESDFEIVSLTGTITTKDNEVYPHIHISVGDDKGHVVGGHLNEAIVSVTCEVVLRIIEGSVDRYYDEDIGINLLKL